MYVMTQAAGFSSQWLLFDLGPVHVRFVVYKVALVLVFLQVLQPSPIGMLPTVLHTHLHINPTLIIRTSGNSVGDFARISTTFRRNSTYALVSSFKVLNSVSWT